ncbi:hypothetical protein OAS39_04000 [Pirellulales bacterium]|nr:hypothetical protein [Pirellulales bacterium]
MSMDWNQIKNQWNAVSDKIKLTWGKLSDEDLRAVAGRRDQLAIMLERRYGYATAVAENKVDEFAKELNR